MNKKLLKLITMIILLAYTLTFLGCQKSETKNDLQTTFNEEMIEANQKFALNIFKTLQVEEKGKDIFISPFSISTALTMVLKGAKGETLEEMRRVLELNDISESDINIYYKDILENLNNYEGNIELAIRNSVWIKKGESIEQEFIDDMENIFSSYVKELDFSKTESIETINSWIEEATNEKIKDMLKQTIPPDVIMYLINAIYFNEDWKYQFDEDKTFTTEFASENGDAINVDMMNSKMNIDYYKEDKFQAVRLPYNEKDLSMLVFLPQEAIKIGDFISNFDLEILNKTLTNLEIFEELIVQIPKFKIEYGTKLLNDPLKSLGMNLPFSAQADFSRIREGLMISRVMHKSFIEVNEQGSEAAAATIVELQETAALEPEIFRADRPFIFLIYDQNSSSILFIGKNS